MIKEYIIENSTTNISADEYVSRFRDEKHLVEFCRQYPNHSNSWGCPSFDFDAGEFLRQYEYTHLAATKIIPVGKNIPIDRTQELIKPKRLGIGRELLEMEHRYRDQAFAYVGKCLYCPDSRYTHECNRPYLYPDKVRPSLEAFGLDITRTLSEFSGIELLWGKDGILPEYLVIVSGLFHDSAKDVTSHTKHNQGSRDLQSYYPH